MNRNLAIEMRPDTFEDFLGNEKIIQSIRASLPRKSSNTIVPGVQIAAPYRLPTAFLFSGVSGTGKTTLARIITNYVGGELMEINAADDTGVDAARSLGELAQYRPLDVEHSYKVIVLDEAHQLTKQAQSALLKHVEDAPSSTLWILCTTEPSKIIPTLRNRCVSYSLSGFSEYDTTTLIKGNTRRIPQYHGALEKLGYLHHEALPPMRTEGYWKLGPIYGSNIIQESKVDEFIHLLVQENVTAPRAVLMATERFAGGMDPLGAIFGTQDAPQAFEIAKAVAKRDWDTVRTALSQATNEEATAIRLVVVNYLKSMLLREPERPVRVSEAIIELTAHIPAIEAFGLAELCARLYNVCERTK